MKSGGLSFSCKDLLLILMSNPPNNQNIPIFEKTENAWHYYNIGGHSFIVGLDYTVTKLIGLGAYGLVWYV